jgi:phage shock protein PspC (stress-responsive transcriptional regulator)
MTQGRVAAGVCLAFGRATNTDPVLWRVLLAVLTLVGGVGLFVYVVGWLLIPGEGDTGSPLEALVGRGRSSTSPVLVVLIGGVAALAAGSFVADGLRPTILVVALLVGALFLLNRGTGQRPWPPPGFGQPAPPTGFGEPAPPPAGPAFTGTSGFAAPTGVATPAGSPGVPGLRPVAGFPPPPPVDPSMPGYRPPFAPHGPYATSPYPYPGLAAPTPTPVRPARPPSRLGRVTTSLMLVALGVLALLDTVGHADVPAGTYLAVSLAVVGLGLVTGAWFGRARGLIVLGLLLSVLLSGSSIVHNVDPLHRSSGDVTWRPLSLIELSDRYEHGFGDATLDLSALNFDGLDRDITVKVNAGTLRVRVPHQVDVEVHAKVLAGDAQIFGTQWEGLNSPRRTVTDNDSDGAGHGHLRLDLDIQAGSVEVTR